MPNARPDPEQFDDFDDYCDALRKLPSLTPAEYLCLLHQDLAYGEEAYCEYQTQYRSECAMFGDAGPGQALQVQHVGTMLADTRSKIAHVKRVIANLAA